MIEPGAFYERTHVAEWLAGLPVFASEHRALAAQREAGAINLTDIGAGSGRLTAHAISLGYRYRAVDSSAAQIDVLRRRHPGVEAIVADAAHLPFDSGTADVALLCFHVLEAIQPRLRRTAVLAETRRILRPDGVLLVSHHRRMRYRPLQQLTHWMRGRGEDFREFGDLVLHGAPRTGGIDVNGLPMHIPSTAALRQQAEATGFRRVESWPLKDASSTFARWASDAVLEQWEAI